MRIVVDTTQAVEMLKEMSRTLDRIKLWIPPPPDPNPFPPIRLWSRRRAT